MRTLDEMMAEAIKNGAVLTDDEAAERERREVEQWARDERERARERLWGLTLPIDAGDESMLLDDRLRDDVGASLRAVQEWTADGSAPPWLVLTGPVGRGKTLAACWAVFRFQPSAYVGARELERLHMTRFGDDAVTRYEDLCKRRGIVVVDDIGREDVAERMGTALLDLVDGRRGSRHRTIAITNLTADALRKRYPDKRLWSRLGASARFVVDAGPDLRAKGKP
jgi:DNA replication protein DnaC